MTRNEVVNLLRFICDAYPNYKPNNLSETADTWAVVLADYDYKIMQQAVIAYIQSDTSGFAPSIGQLVSKSKMFTQIPELNEMEAWSLVSKALRNGYYGAEDEFSKLPPLVQRAVGQPSNLRQWATTDIESIENVVQSNFLRTYRAVCKAESEKVSMSDKLRQAIPENDFYKPQPMIEEQQPDNDGCMPMPQAVRERLDRMFG